MSLREDLARIDRVIEVHGGLLPSPASPDQLEALRAAVSPMTVPTEVNDLYSWHNGCALEMLDGYGLRPIEDTIDDRWFDDLEFDAPPAVLFISVPPRGTGQLVGVTLGLPGYPALPGLWAFETHDVAASTTFDGIGEAVNFYADLVEGLPPSLDPMKLAAANARRIPGEVDLYRIPSNPEPFFWPSPLPKSFVRRQYGSTWPEDMGAWPDQWTASLRYR